MKLSTVIVATWIGTLALHILRGPKAGLPSPALDDLFRDVDSYMKNHPNSSKEDVTRRLCKERFGFDNPYKEHRRSFRK